VDKAVADAQRQASRKHGRHRKSLFRETSTEASFHAQKEFPKEVSRAFSVYSLVYGVALLAMAVLHVVAKPHGCDEKMWEKGCVNKIPFCKNKFTPSCDCAALFIVNDFNLTALPNSMVDEMTGLRKVFVQYCNLTALPPRMEQLTEMVDFQVTANRLEAFDVDVRKWNNLNILYLGHNNITRYNEIAVWNHPGVVAVALDGNVGLRMPTSGISLPSLNLLNLQENDMVFTTPFQVEFFPQLLYLFLSGNHLKVFPANNLKNILYLDIARCKLIDVPLAVSQYRDLRYLDARDNNITTVEDDLKALIEKNNVEAYFSGNAVCNEDSSLDCKPLCSKTCWGNEAMGNGFCDIECNSKECDHDGGDCKYN
jgi:hypothetical protein